MASETSNKTLLDFTSICRLCLGQKSPFYPVFNEHNTVELPSCSLALQIKACVEIEIISGDDLPDKICYRCLEQLENWVKFKELCENANTLLLQCAAGGIQSLSDEILQKNSQHNNNACLDLPETSSDFHFVDISLLEQDSLLQRLDITQNDGLTNNKSFVGDLKPELLKYDHIGTHANESNENEDESNIEREIEAKELIKNKFRIKYINLYSKKFNCGICETVFTKYSSLLQHDKVEHQNIIPEEMCVICGKLFVTKLRLDMHKHLKHKGKMYKCEICGMKSVSKKSLKVHKLRHSGRFVCNVCNFVASTNRSLNDHLNIHKTERSYCCKVCLRTFKQQQALEHHFKRHDDDPVLRAKCDVCLKKFKTFDMLRKHKASHTLKIYGEICEICGAILKTKSSLYTHKLSHSEKRHMCMICDKLFSTKNLLNRHMLVHGERPFPCKICSKSFTRADTLSLHLNTHSKSQLFYCQQCNRAFSLNRYLKRHITRMHVKS